jgi:hypothetical protein
MNNASPTYNIGYDAFVFAENALGNDFDNGASVQINYAARGLTPGNSEIICSSGAYACPLYKVQAGDSVTLNTTGPTNIVLFVMRLADV